MIRHRARLAAAVAAGTCFGLGMTAAAGAPKPAAVAKKAPAAQEITDFSGYYFVDENSDVLRFQGPITPDTPPGGWRSFRAFTTNGNAPPPVKPEVMEGLRKARADEERLGFFDDQQTAKCRAPHFLTTYGFPQLWDLIQRKDELVMISKRWGAIPRHVLIGGKHPPAEEWQPTPNGHAVAHWEGAELVIDTIGMADNTWLLQRDRLHHSEQLHIVERLSLSKDKQLLTNHMLIEDPVYFTRPWTLTFQLRRAPAGTEPTEAECIIEQVARGTTAEKPK